MKVESCQRLNVVCASRRLQARSVHDSVFYLGIARGPIFIGEVRSISHWSPYDRVGVVNADP